MADAERSLRGNLQPWAWRPGQSGNPRGGNVSAFTLARRARVLTGQGEEVLALYLQVLRGQPFHIGRRLVVPSIDQRMQAAAWLADRGYGRAREVIEISDVEMSREERRALLHVMSDEERALLATLLARAREKLDAQALPVVSPLADGPTDAPGESALAPGVDRTD